MAGAVYGVDGCRGPKAAASRSWFVVSFDDEGTFGSAQLVESFEGVVEQTRGGDLVLIDIPIGLPDGNNPSRSCDQAARCLVGPRRSSVFPAPSRPALVAKDYREANDHNRQTIGKGLSQQAWHICPRIADVDAVLGSQPNLRARYRESHPEVCFTALNRWCPAEHPKRHPDGQKERREILTRYGCNVSRWFEQQCGVWRRSVVDPTDVLDAMALAVVARHALAHDCPTLPVDPLMDARGLRMEMVCPTAPPG